MWMLALLLVLLPSFAVADIYRYKDASGTWVISNTPPPESTISATQTNEGQSQNASPSPPAINAIKQNKKEEINKALSALSILSGRWKNAMQLATVTARITLAGPVNTLQAIKQETEALLVPDCLSMPKQALVESMHEMIESFLGFMANADSVPGSRFSKGLRSFGEYEEGVRFCTPS